MKVTTFLKAGVSTSAAAALTLGLCATAFAAGPTATEEDPTTTPPATALVGVGSDTTQDVLYGLAQTINASSANTIFSYTATGGTSITYRSGLVATRPNGSGAGYNALKDAIGVTTAGLAKAGDVDFARASGTQGTAASGTSGVTTDIPFASDTMSFAVPAGSPFLKTNSGKGLTITDLYNIYAGVDTYVDTTDGSLETASGTNFVPINAFVPKPGSGSRQFFLAQLATQGSGINLTANSSTKGDGLWTSAGTPSGTAPYIGAVTYDAKPVQEHEATVLTTAPSTVAAIAPFSGAKFIGYHNGTIADPDTGKVAGTDYALVPFYSSVSGGAVLPYTGDASVSTSTLAPNSGYVTNAKQGGSEAAFALTRNVYNIIATAAVKGGGTSSNAKYNLLYKTFVGTSSSVCQATSTISAYGFLPLTATSGTNACGDTSRTFDTASTSTVTTSATAATAGGSTTITVGVQSNGDGGGTAVLTGGVSGTVTIASGSTSGTLSVPTPTAGSLSYNVAFTPALGGVAASQATGSVTVSAVAPSLSSVKITGKAKVGKKLTAVVSPAGLSGVTYQWYAKGKKIKGATKATLKLTKKLKKKKVSVKATYKGVTKSSAAVKVK
ncbi:MAG: hypothetical protein QM572_15185 [Nocardioides sp.]|uniref:hypothetical protein n=1 Tax=Nocardioides sp. TaxID=35761 RepID=UPI0039E4FEA5